MKGNSGNVVNESINASNRIESYQLVNISNRTSIIKLRSNISCWKRFKWSLNEQYTIIHNYTKVQWIRNIEEPLYVNGIKIRKEWKKHPFHWKWISLIVCWKTPNFVDVLFPHSREFFWFFETSVLLPI